MVTSQFGRPAALQRRNTISKSDAGDINDTIRPGNLMDDRREGFPTELVDWDIISSPKRSFSYTSLRDLIHPSPVRTQSLAATDVDRCHAAATPNGAVGEIPIRNRLVKHAAWAYLQPMAASPGSAGPSFFRSLWTRFSQGSGRNPGRSCFGFFRECIFSPISRVLRRLLVVLGFPVAADR